MTTALTQATLTDPVTRHARKDFTRLNADQTVEQALAGLRERPPEGRIIYFYVTDADGRLVGVVPTRRLLLSKGEARIADIMVRQVIALPETATVLDACEFFTLHRLLAFPILDGEKRIIGVVDVELYTDELSTIETNESNESLFQLIGVHIDETRPVTPWSAFRLRFPWLLCSVVSGILAAFLAGLYEAQLRAVVVLALFIPVVLALSESVAIQSVTLALRQMQLIRPSWAILLRRLGQELPTGFLLGAACAVLVGLVALVWKQLMVAAICITGGIAGGMTLSAVVGLGWPYLLRLLKVDPQVAAGPIALASADMLTLLLYFNLAVWLL